MRKEKICPKCKNFHLGVNYCNKCGSKLEDIKIIKVNDNIIIKTIKQFKEFNNKMVKRKTKKVDARASSPPFKFAHPFSMSKQEREGRKALFNESTKKPSKRKKKR